MAAHNVVKRMPVRAKLVAGFVLLILTLIGVSLSSWWTFSLLEGKTQRMGSVYAPQIERIRDVEVLMIRISLEARHAMLSQAGEDRDKSIGKIVDLRSRMMNRLQEFERHISTPRGREIYADIQQADKEFWRLAELVVAKIK
ncbi:MAG: MCP four helix bundle domain-containing protein, partial [Fimbriimonadales bacterium]|nr:MCP four helix bundle domain-containing protein [Fimbriimonadales bacterium]